jgi:large subunit ribosomal protein L9
MELILREHVEKLGRRGDIVKVRDGYARNYLLPRRLALPATAANKQQIERERVVFEVKEAEEKKIAEAIATRIAALECVMTRRVGDAGALYGSVTAADIAEFLAGKGLDVEKRKVQLAEPIKELGDFIAPIRLHRDVVAQLQVRVVKEV